MRFRPTPLRQLLLAFAMSAFSTLAVAVERVALIIGNAQYQHAPYLSNPMNDAKAVAEQLVKLGFEVDEPLYNLDRAAMVKALREFGRKARSAKAAVVYYAGHGMEVQGENYLLPVDARLEYQADAPFETLPLSAMLNQIAGAQDYRLVILDACRDNPLANQMRRRDGTRAAYRGLEPVEPTTQTYVAYAAKAGTRARDGSGKHSPFTQALLKHLPQRLPLERLFGAVREDVLRQTGKAQEPHLYGAFGLKPIYLAGGSLREDTPITSANTGELSVSSQPPGAMIYVDGGRLGVAPQSLKNLPAGQVTVEAKLQGYESYRERVWIRAGKKSELHIVLTPIVQKPKLPTTPEPEMVFIEGACFQMGSPNPEEGRDKDETRHKACVKDFYLGKYEVTVGEFRRFIKASGYKTEAEQKDGCYFWDGEWKQDADKHWRSPGFEQNDDHPVACVSWNDALAYIEWLNKQTGKNYQLPTEAEWEYAARAGTTTARYWGEEADVKACRYANVADKGHGSSEPNFPCDDGYKYTAPVGRFEPNAFGLYDMLGNLWEWSCSEYKEAYEGQEKQCISNNRVSPYSVCCGAVPGSTDRRGCARRPATGPRWRSATTSGVFASPGRFNPLFFILFPFASWISY